MFEGFAANKELIEKISPAVESGRISHCVLISGERGTGRNLFARMLAAEIVAGENAQLRQKLLEAEHERIFTLDGENSKGKTNVITIEQVRGLKAQLSRMAFAGGARAVLIKNIENLNAASANALLKILEEPPESTYFIMTATSVADVLPTVLSRAALYALAAASVDECAQFIKAIPGYTPQHAALPRFFGGRIGLCAACIKNKADMQLYLAAAAATAAIEQGNAYELLKILAGYEKDRQAAQALLLFVSYGTVSALSAGAAAGNNAKRLLAAGKAAGAAAQSFAQNVGTKLILTAFAAKAIS